MARLFAACLFVFCMVFRQGSSLKCYQCASSLFPECLDDDQIQQYAAECAGALTLCSVVATKIDLPNGEEIHETTRQCATAHAEGCTTSEEYGQIKETCTVTCDTNNCNAGPGKVIPTTTTPAPSTEPAPTTTTTTEAAVVTDRKAGNVTPTPAGGSAGIAKMNLFVVVLSALTVLFHL